MRSPLATARSMSRSTWNSPYHLLTLSNSTMGAIDASACARPSGSSPGGAAFASAGVQVPFDPAAVARHREAARRSRWRPRTAGLRGRTCASRRRRSASCTRAGQVVQADDGDQRGVLEGADEGVDDGRHDDAQRLRQHDLALRLPVAQARATAPPRSGPWAAPAGRRARPRPGRPRRTASCRPARAAARRCVPPCGMNSGNMNEAMNSTRDQRHAADQLDVEHAQRADRRQLRLAAQRHQHRERKGDHQAHAWTAAASAAGRPSARFPPRDRPSHAAAHQHEEDRQHQPPRRSASHGFQNARMAAAPPAAPPAATQASERRATARRTGSGRTGSAGTSRRSRPSRRRRRCAARQAALSAPGHGVRARPSRTAAAPATASSAITASVSQRVGPAVEEVAPQPRHGTDLRHGRRRGSAIGTKPSAGRHQRSFTRARRLYQFISADVSSDSVR